MLRNSAPLRLREVSVDQRAIFNPGKDVRHAREKTDGR